MGNFLKNNERLAAASTAVAIALGGAACAGEQPSVEPEVATQAGIDFFSDSPDAPAATNTEAPLEEVSTEQGPVDLLEGMTIPEELTAVSDQAFAAIHLMMESNKPEHRESTKPSDRFTGMFRGVVRVRESVEVGEYREAPYLVFDHPLSLEIAGGAYWVGYDREHRQLITKQYAEVTPSGDLMITPELNDGIELYAFADNPNSGKRVYGKPQSLDLAGEGLVVFDTVDKALRDQDTFYNSTATFMMDGIASTSGLGAPMHILHDIDTIDTERNLILEMQKQDDLAELQASNK